MKTLKAFVVEDSPVVSDSLVAALEELAPVEVLGVTTDEPSAVQWIEEHADECDVVITDIFLKRGSGLGVVRAGTLLPRKRMLTVVITNYATPDMRRKCLELGAEVVFDNRMRLTVSSHTVRAWRPDAPS